MPSGPALTEPEALAIIQDGRGSHFDPGILDLFLERLPEIRAIREKTIHISRLINRYGDRLRLSVASTNLDDWPTAANGKVLLSGDVVLTLDGRWTIGQVDAVTPRQCLVRSSPDKTTLSVPFKDFMPVRITLMPE